MELAERLRIAVTEGEGEGVGDLGVGGRKEFLEMFKSYAV